MSTNNKKKSKKKAKKPAEVQASSAVASSQQLSKITAGSVSAAASSPSTASTSKPAAPAASGKTTSTPGIARPDWSAFSKELFSAMPDEAPAPPQAFDADSLDSLSSDSSDDGSVDPSDGLLDAEREPGERPIMSLPAHMRVIEVEYRINRVLRREGETEIMLPIIERMDDSVSPPVAIYNSDRPHPEDCHRRTTVLLSALRWRKPALHRRVSGMLAEYNRSLDKLPAPLKRFTGEQGPLLPTRYHPVPGAELLKEMK